MQERRSTSRRLRTPRTPDELAVAIGAARRREVRRRLAPERLAALAGSIESVAATAGPVVEATAEAARGDDPAREEERLAVALRNLEVAISEAAGAVRAALQDIEGAPRRSPRHK